MMNSFGWTACVLSRCESRGGSSGCHDSMLLIKGNDYDNRRKDEKINDIIRSY